MRAQHRMIVLEHPKELTLEVVERVAFDREPLRIAPGLLEQIDARRSEMLEALADGRRVYGVNTAMGYLAGADLDPDEQLHHQRNLLLGRAVGSAPYLPAPEARAVMVTRLVNFLSGHAGVTGALCAYICERLADDFVPAIPRTSIGCAGEIIPLAHAFQTFLGVGQVLDAAGRPSEAGPALRSARAEPYVPQAKEGVALLGGSPGAAALAVARRRATLGLEAHLTISAACALDALQAPLDAIDEAVGRLSADPLLEDVLEVLNQLLTGSPRRDGKSQAPVSFRVIPQVHAHLARAIARLEEDLRRALVAVTDSPAFVDGRFVSTGGFHAVGLTASLEAVAGALAHAAALAGQRIHRLLAGRFSGLPDQLSPTGRGAGLVTVQKRAVGALAELQRLAGSGPVGYVDTSMGQEDAQTFTFDAAERLRRIEELSIEVIACELLAVRQAWALRAEPLPEGLRAVSEALAAAVPPLTTDRPLGPDVDALVALVESGTLRPHGQR